MGSCLTLGNSWYAKPTLAFVALTLAALLNVHEVAAQPKRASTTASMALDGTYVLTRAGGRTIRDRTIVRSRLIFAARGTVIVETNCARFTTSLQERGKQGYVLGFAPLTPIATRCRDAHGRGEKRINRLFSDVANIARAGNSLTFLDVKGTDIALWSAEPSMQTTVELAVPQPGAPAPVRAYYGDYELAELYGRPLTHYGARWTQESKLAPVLATSPEAMPPHFPVNARLVTALPTLRLMASGSVTGSSGCGDYTSTLSSDPKSGPSLGLIKINKKPCVNLGMTAVEGQFLDALHKARHLDINSARVDLIDEAGVRLARLNAIATSR